MGAHPAGSLAATLIDELVRCGMRHVCLAPGSRSAPLALACAADARIEHHVFIDERSASFAALGLARATDRAVGVVCTSGTATANLFPAVHEAHHGRVPLVLLTADRPPELRHTGANQTIDQVKLYGDAVRWFADVEAPWDEVRPDYWRSLAARGYSLAVGSPPGPVHLNVAFREPLVVPEQGVAAALGGRTDGAPWTSAPRTGSAPAASEMDRLLDEVGGAQRGVIVAGAGDAAGWSDLAEHLGWPLLADPLSNQRRGANSISTYDGLLRVEDFVRAHRPDLVLLAGALGISKPLKAYVAGAPKQILVDPDGWWLDPDRTVDRVLRADPARVAAEVARRSAPPDDTGWLGSWTAAEAAARRALDTELDSHARLTEPRLARDLVDLLPDGANLIVAASMPFRDVEAFARSRGEVRFHGNRGANGIDGFTGTCVGVALSGSSQTFALAGDLSLLHDQNALIRVSDRRLDLTIVVANNDGGGIFSFLPQARVAEHFEELFGTPHHMDLVQLARTYGIEHTLASTSDELGAAIGAPNRGVCLVEVRTERADNVDVHTRCHEVVRDALT